MWLKHNFGLNTKLIVTTQNMREKQNQWLQNWIRS